MKASTLQQLSTSLRERLSVIADHQFRDRDPVSHLKKLQEVSEAIEASAAALSKTESDPKLRHYLERRSYDKALAWIESEGYKHRFTQLDQG